MEKLNCALEDYIHEEKRKRILDHLKSLTKSEMDEVLTKEFKGWKNYFHFAVQSNLVEIAEVLILNGANVNDHFFEPRPNICSLLDFVVRQNFTEMICLFLRHGATFNSSHLKGIFLNDNTNVVEFIARNTKLLNGYFALEDATSIATDYGKLQIIKILLSLRHADFDLVFFVSLVGSTLKTNLMENELVKVFLNYGPSISSRDKEGISPIEYALESNTWRTKNVFKLMVYFNTFE